jgi:hypothetical protein
MAGISEYHEDGWRCSSASSTRLLSGDERNDCRGRDRASDPRRARRDCGGCGWWAGQLVLVGVGAGGVRTCLGSVGRGAELRAAARLRGALMRPCCASARPRNSACKKSLDGSEGCMSILGAVRPSCSCRQPAASRGRTLEASSWSWSCQGEGRSRFHSQELHRRSWAVALRPPPLGRHRLRLNRRRPSGT